MSWIDEIRERQPKIGFEPNRSTQEDADIAYLLILVDKTEKQLKAADAAFHALAAYRKDDE